MALERLRLTQQDLDDMWARIEKLTGRSRDEAVVDETLERQDYLAQARQRNADYRRAISRKLSEIPEIFQGATFDRYVATESNGRAIVAAERVVKSGFRVGLGLYGDPGVGKSMLAAIVANAAIAEGRLTIYSSVRRMLDTIKDAYNDAETRQERDATELRMIKRYASIDVLILNDLGKEPLTRWSVEMLYAIMDDRWEQGRRLVLTANLNWPDLLKRYTAPLAGLDESTGLAMMDRIGGMTELPWIEICGESQRWGA